MELGLAEGKCMHVNNQKYFMKSWMLTSGEMLSPAF